MTALHLAAKEGYLDIVRVLCLARSQVSAKTKDGLTAEILALSQEHTSVAALLAKLKQVIFELRLFIFFLTLGPTKGSLHRSTIPLRFCPETDKTQIVRSLYEWKDQINPGSAFNKGNIRNYRGCFEKNFRPL